ncbi:hypothetical protein [uncultured Devosia sp.]|uniref:hypothetical protein n=1 Tax=uncultured Devosia sp. TaxID=211434 RepID=UPI0035C9F2C0
MMALPARTVAPGEKPMPPTRQLEAPLAPGIVWAAAGIAHNAAKPIIINFPSAMTFSMSDGAVFASYRRGLAEYTFYTRFIKPQQLPGQLVKHLLLTKTYCCHRSRTSHHRTAKAAKVRSSLR